MKCPSFTFCSFFTSVWKQHKCSSLEKNCKKYRVFQKNLYHCNDVIIIVDLNTYFKRKNNISKRSESFLKDMKFEYAWSSRLNVDFTHEFVNNGLSFTASLDHILWSKNLNHEVITSCWKYIQSLSSILWNWRK